MSKIVFSAKGEWTGYSIAKSAKGYILTIRSRVQGCRDNVRILVPFNTDFPENVDFTADWNKWMTNADYFCDVADQMPGAKVLQYGHIVY